jgi:hypothetical protein
MSNVLQEEMPKERFGTTASSRFAAVLLARNFLCFVRSLS